MLSGTEVIDRSKLIYRVPSASVSGKYYDVDMNAAFCTCPVGLMAAPASISLLYFVNSTYQVSTSCLILVLKYVNYMHKLLKALVCLCVTTMDCKKDY